jgi:hypothetical protein
MIFSCAVSFKSKKKKNPDLSLPPCRANAKKSCDDAFRYVRNGTVLYCHLRCTLYCTQSSGVQYRYSRIHLNFADFDKKITYQGILFLKTAVTTQMETRLEIIKRLLTHGGHFFEHMTKHGATSMI